MYFRTALQLPQTGHCLGAEEGAAVLAGAPSAGTSKQVPASATGAAVAKQAGVAKTTGPVLPPSVDVNSDAAAAAASKATGPVLPPSVDVNSATMKGAKVSKKASSSTPAIADTEVKTLAVKGISEHDSHTPEGAKAIQEIKKAKDTVKAAANGKTLEEAKKVVQLEKKEAKVSGSSRHVSGIVMYLPFPIILDRRRRRRPRWRRSWRRSRPCVRSSPSACSTT